MNQKNSPDWEQLVERGVSVAEASAQMRCSRRTALKSLKMAAARIEQRAVKAEQAKTVANAEIGTAAERTNWPVAFIEMADRIEREGADKLVAERRRLAQALPRGITSG